MFLIKRSIKVSVTESISFFSCSYVCQFLLKNFAVLYIYKYIHKIVVSSCFTDSSDYNILKNTSGHVLWKSTLCNIRQ